VPKHIQRESGRGYNIGDGQLRSKRLVWQLTKPGGKKRFFRGSGKGRKVRRIASKEESKGIKRGGVKDQSSITEGGLLKGASGTD